MDKDQQCSGIIFVLRGGRVLFRAEYILWHVAA